MVDTNVLIDVLEGDPKWSAWSRDRIADARSTGRLFVNHVVVAELVGHAPPDASMEDVLSALEIGIQPLTTAAATLAGAAFREYRRRGGARDTILPDFLVAGHAAALGMPLVTRDRRLGRYFPDLAIIAPD